ncbi:alpha/beta fold hydrolase [Shewanella sp. KX20019]|uniref:alpha/beta fold hydrolase n=1 Tax=Shewanella sp. KX20019 TaxID=2803864 RepID=UPI0019285C92|nr:alpha/beta fold hydrolase [Shewanella sp. KX20019]QQX79697.1 alpha/beta fold hydrolase [Shewanella sp. KX20019]
MAILKVTLVTILILLVSSCANFRDLAQEVDMLNNTYVEYQVNIESQHQVQSFVFILLQQLDADSIDGYEVVIGNQQVTVTTDSLSQYLFTFNDVNNDLRFQVGEAYSISVLSKKTNGAKIDLTLSHSQHDYPTALVDKPLFNLVNVKISPAKIGENASLSESKFDRATAKLGMWKPVTHLLEGNSGIFFIDEFDKNKIPIIFIHGMNGTARDFSPLIAKVDRQKYQVWVMNYPSGLPLELLANGVNSLIKIIDYRYDIETIHLVAHSMGGLVTQAYLDLCRNQLGCDDIASFTSISSPFGGVSSAQNGVDYSPVVMPAWRDLAPSSHFIGKLFSNTEVNPPPHLLIFGYKMSGLINQESSDGVISLASQLTEKAQKRAIQIYGLHEDHLSILSNDKLASSLHLFWQHSEQLHAVK